MIISVPLTFIRDYSCPMGEMEAWDRRRASIVPVTIVISFFYLNGNLQANPGESIFEKPDMQISLYSMIPGIIFGLLIAFRTKKSIAPL